MAPDDINRRMQILEAERAVDAIENDLNTASFEVAQAFKEFEAFTDPVEAEDAARELMEVYGVYHPDLKTADGAPKLLGFRHPQTGEKVSPYQLLKRTAERIERHREAGARIGQQNEAKMRAVAQTPSTTKHVDSRDDSKLSADEYAKKHGLKVVGG